MRSAIAAISCAAVLALVNLSIIGKEQQLASGKIIYLELAPVDPRSLMQGDYMALRFKIANDARQAMPLADAAATGLRPAWPNLATADGRIVASLDKSSVATYRRLDNGAALAPDEILLLYRVREGQVKFATNAFFFQEGTAPKFAGARYGEFRVAADGNLLMTGLRDKELRPLG
jgi:uncharacterized membrane-anchored protein